MSRGFEQVVVTGQSHVLKAAVALAFDQLIDRDKITALSHTADSHSADRYSVVIVAERWNP